jgi:Hint domain
MRTKYPLNPARRNFLAVTAAATARVAAVGTVATIIPSLVQAQNANGNNGNANGVRGNGNGRGNSGNGNGNGGPACFLPGTGIRTPAGEVPIENLRVGDLILTLRGEAMPIKWIARQVFKKSGSSWPERVMPIRVARHALDDHTPHADLYLSPGHPLFIDGHLIPVKDLVNGVSIAPALPEGTQTIEYFQIVLATHEVIFAEGAPAETFLVEGEGWHESFTNFIEYERLYPGEAGFTMTRFAPLAACYGGRAELKALLRRGISTVVDVRDPLQRAYDRIAARAGELVA